MKKFLMPVMLFLVVLSACVPVYADNFISGTENADAILENDKDFISVESKDWLNEKTGFPIENREYAYNRSKCVYYNIDLLENDYIDNEKMQEYINSENVYSVYELPVYFDGGTLIMNLVKGDKINDSELKDMSENEAEHLKKTENRWYPQSHFVKTEHYDYIAYLEKLLLQNNINDANVYLTGGPTKALGTLAVICTGDEAAQFLILDNSDYSDSRLYSLDEIRQLAQETADIFDEDNPIGAGNEKGSKIKSGIIISAVVFAAVAVSAVAVIIISRKKNADVQ